MTARFKIVATLIAACALAAPSIAVHAQASTTPARPGLPGVGASAAASAPTGPRLRTPHETANQAAAPGDLRPERAVAPQISIPFGKKPTTTPRRVERLPPRGKAAAAGTVDDAAARCGAQADPQERATCRAKLAREARTKLPN